MERCVNLDETAVRLLPLGERGWARRGAKDVKFLGDSRTHITVTLAVDVTGRTWHQLIFGGKTEESMPDFSTLPDNPNRILHQTESHWQSSETLFEFVHFLD